MQAPSRIGKNYQTLSPPTTTLVTLFPPCGQLHHQQTTTSITPRRPSRLTTLSSHRHQLYQRRSTRPIYLHIKTAAMVKLVCTFRECLASNLTEDHESTPTQADIEAHLLSVHGVEGKPSAYRLRLSNSIPANPRASSHRTQPRCHPRGPGRSLGSRVRGHAEGVVQGRRSTPQAPTR